METDGVVCTTGARCRTTVKLLNEIDVEDATVNLGNTAFLGTIDIVGGHVMYESQTALKKIFPASGVTKVYGDFHVRGTNHIKTLEFMAHIRIITGNLIISGNKALESLDGLSKNLVIGGQFKVLKNDNLINFGETVGTEQLYVKGQ